MAPSDSHVTPSNSLSLAASNSLVRRNVVPATVSHSRPVLFTLRRYRSLLVL